MDEDALCNRDGCGHPISAHNMRRPEKRARLTGTMVSDFPSGHEEAFNIHSGRNDDACSEPDCRCPIGGRSRKRSCFVRISWLIGLSAISASLIARSKEFWSFLTRRWYEAAFF